MSIIKTLSGNINSFHQSSIYLERPRLNRLLENAANYPLIAVYAGSGYGKTRAVYSFLQENDAQTTWMQITERDNITTHFWEKYSHMISLIWPESGARLREIGVPETEDGFAKYEAVRSDTLSSQGKCFFVYDDFHLLHNPVILRTFERILSSLPPNGTVILISRTMPEINMTGMMLHERVTMIREDALRFTEDEIAEYFNQISLSVTRQDIRDVYDDTRGWAFAINLIGRSLSKNAKYERYALVAMKENIFKLIETEISQFINKPLWHFMLSISLLDHLAASLIKTLAGDGALIKELDKLNAYIRYDHHLGAYMIHNLFLEYLRQHQYLLSDDEKREIYNKAGMWCEDNNYQTDALAYYEKAGNYEAIMRIIYLFNTQVSQDLAAYAMEILERIPEEVALHNPLFPAMCIKIKLSLGLLNEASASAEEFAGEYEKRPQSPENNRILAGIYGAWATLRLVMSPNTNIYDFDIYFKKMQEYYDKNPYETFGPVTNQPVGAYALLIETNRAGAPEEFIKALSRAIPHSSHVLRGNMYGLDDLARGELYYYQRNLNGAEQYLNMALDKARSKGQYDIQNRTLQYLMLIAFSRGEINKANSLLQQTEALLEVKEYSTRYEAYDIARSNYCLLLGQPEELPDWLKSDFVQHVNPTFIESYANRIRAQYHYITRQYTTLLAFLESFRESHMLLLGKIVFKVLEALSLYQVKRREEAISALTEAYILAEPNRIIVPFTQYSKDMRTLTAAALRDSKCNIPKPWLEDINRKSSAFARRLSHMALENRAANNDDIILTNRETKILKDLSQGFSRTEIAASQNISVNTVKMVINVIYDKLSVSSCHDAIRIAIARKIV